MITRRNRINYRAKEVSLAVAFGQADVKRWLKDFLNSFTFDDLESFQSLDFREQDLRYYAEHDPFVFGSFEQPWRSHLSAWLWTQWQDASYFTASATQEGIYFFSPKALALVGKKSRQT